MTNPDFAVLNADPLASTPEYAALINTYSPILVLFPETYALGSPWEKDRLPSDYQPRPVEMYLQGCGLRSPTKEFGAPKGWLGALAVMGVNSAIRGFLGATRRPKILEPGELKELVTRLYLEREGKPTKEQRESPILDKYSLDNGVQESDDAWSKYHELIKNPAYKQTCYVTAVRQKPRIDDRSELPVEPEYERLAITYWFFYYFNDYWNRHQADFETMTVFFRRKKMSTEGFSPTGCGFGAHAEGLYRFWPDVRRLEIRNKPPLQYDTHPIGLVARGSHAFYPAPREGGHIPATEIARDFAKRVRYRLAVSPLEPDGNPREDSVVKATPTQIGAATPGSYSIQVVPELSEITPTSDHWDTWWWLHYGGLWGHRNWIPPQLVRLPGINGPVRQGNRWTDPWCWLETCRPDGAMNWTDL